MRYTDKTPEQKEARKEYMKKYMKKRRSEPNDSYMENKMRRRNEHKLERNAYMKDYNSKDVNSAGVTKHWIRVLSNRILFKKHYKLRGYEIHHCFGYEDPSKFIYIPRTLHQQIHQMLRDDKIPADSNHWNSIRDIVNSCEEYTFISC